jgi:predicted enzyme related to lactoylglutathione lyase
LGNDIGCEHRHRYDVDRQTVHQFRSGYVNTSCARFRLAHQHLIVPDVQHTVSFYEQVFGATKIEEVAVNGMPLVMLHLESGEVWVSGPIIPGLQTHVALAADDFEAAVEELRMRWVEFISEPLHIGRQHVVFIKDHNGQHVGIASER